MPRTSVTPSRNFNCERDIGASQSVDAKNRRLGMGIPSSHLTTFASHSRMNLAVIRVFARRGEGKGEMVVGVQRGEANPF
jgi:hypothetical protein